MASIFITALAGFAAYLVFAGSLAASEMATAAGAALLTGAWCAALRRVTSIRFRFSPAHVRPWLRAIARLPAGGWRTGLALARAVLSPEPPGRADRLAFRPGRGDDPTERARRATALLAVSLSPDSYAIRAEPGRGEIVLHGIGDRPGRADPEWLA